MRGRARVFISSIGILKPSIIVTGVVLKRLTTISQGLKYSRNMGEAHEDLQQGERWVHYIFISLTLTNSPVGYYYYHPILQMKRLRHREVKCHVQGHPEH